ncbi:MAG: PD-(D/E)XK nuclease family protein [Candidatus Odinarchaeia archaeon]
MEDKVKGIGYILDRIADVRETILSYIEDRGDIAAGVKEKALVAFTNTLIDWDEAKSRAGEIHASDLLSPCMRLSYYSKMLPPLFDLNSIMRMLIGKLFHAIPILKHHEYSIVWEGIHFTIDEYEDGILIEKKTTSKIKRSWSSRSEEFGKVIPYPNHVEQLKFYKAALEETGHRVYQAVILYLERPTGEVEVAPVEIPRYDIEQIKEELKAKKELLETCLKENKLPPRTVCWKCNKYCGYSSLCFSNMNVVKV